MAKWDLTIGEINWSKPHVVHTTANRSFHFVDNTRTPTKCTLITKARVKRTKLLFILDNLATIFSL